MARVRTLSLFSGCGGMDLGLMGGFSYLGKHYDRNEFELVFAADNDPYAARIYDANFEHKCHKIDVRELDTADLPEYDLLIGGFPCQSFSISAQNPPRLGYKDERGMLFFEIVRLLKAQRPRFFIAENVKGIRSANKGKAFPMILEEFSNAGYEVQHYLVNAADYGVPQRRERVLILGFRDKLDAQLFRFPSALHTPQPVLGDVVMEECNKDETLFFSSRAVAGMLAVKDKMNKGRVMDLAKPCNTISAHLAKVSLNSTDPVLMYGGRYRRFSPREAARIQSFPDEFQLDAVSSVRQYKAIGNAVPPVLMWHVARALQECVERVEEAKALGLGTVVASEQLAAEHPTLEPVSASIRAVNQYLLFEE